MAARGRLAGVLVIGTKRSGDSYAPDESSAIESVAQSVGGALDILTMRYGAAVDGITAEVQRLRTALETAAERFEEATARLTSVVERLNGG